jgi:hypothetical protein
MKKITLFLFLLTAAFGYSQEVLEDFEGTVPSTALFDGFTSATVTANPTNAAEKSLQLITSASGQSWQGAKLVIENNTIDMTTTDKTMSVDIYSTTPRDFLFKLVDGDIGGSDIYQESKTSGVHGGSGWETITLDFNVGADTGQPGYNPPNDKFGGLVFFPLYKAPNVGWEAASETTTFIDNVTAIAGGVAETCSDGIQNNGETGIDCGGPNCNACPVIPTTAPTAPPVRNSWDVLSFFSDAYASVGLNNVGWDDGDAISETIAGNTVLKMQVGNFLGQNLGTAANATDMTHFHMDYYVADEFTAGQVLNSKLSNHAAGGGEVNSIQINVALTEPDVQAWKSIDVALDGDRENIVEFLITVSNTIGLAYLDNIYLYREAVASTDNNALLGFSMYPNPAANKLNISAENTIETASIYNVLGRKVKSFSVNAKTSSLDVSSLSTGIYILKYTANNVVGSMKFIKQ